MPYLSTIKMHWGVNERRKDKRTGALQPVEPSKYFKYLSSKGAGFNEQEADRADIERLQLDDK